MSQITVKLLKSRIGCSKRQLSTLNGLGLKHINQEKVLQDSACVRGMIEKVQHLISVN